MIRFTMIITLLFSSTAWAADRYLYEFHKNRFTTISKLLPNRVFADYDEKLKQWVFRLTDKNAKYAVPLEGLMAGTVLDGQKIGADAEKKYELTVENKWIPVKGKKEAYTAMVDAPRPTYVRGQLSSK